MDTLAKISLILIVHQNYDHKFFAFKKTLNKLIFSSLKKSKKVIKI